MKATVVQLTDNQYDSLRKLVYERKRSLASFVREAVDDFLLNIESKKGASMGDNGIIK